MSKDVYIRNKNPRCLEYSHEHKFNMDELENIIIDANNYFIEAYKVRHKYDPANFIPLRGTSGGVGEAFAAILADSNKNLIENPHPDGYPDILPLIVDAKEWIENPTVKDFKHGGFDVKGKFISDGDRLDVGASAHHRYTSAVLNVIWTWRNNAPFIIALAYINNLKEDDWGVPKMSSNGGKTTPSCSLKGNGKSKLRMNWLFVHENYKRKIVSKYEWIGLING